MLLFGLMNFYEKVFLNRNAQFFPDKPRHQFRLTVTALSDIPFGHGNRKDAVKMRNWFFASDILGQKTAQRAGITSFIVKLKTLDGICDNSSIEKWDVKALEKGFLKADAIHFSAVGAKGIIRYPW